MSENELLEKIKQLPRDYQQEVKDFIDYMLERKLGMPVEKKSFMNLWSIQRENKNAGRI